MAEALRLAAPCVGLKDSYRGLVREFRDGGEPLVPFTLSLPHENFTAFVADLLGFEKGIGIPPGFVPHSTFWLLRDGGVVGASNLRHRLTDALRVDGGHIGYGIRPSARGQGLGREILRLTLAEAAKRGIGRVLVTCARRNVASARAIAANGGTLDSESWVEARGEIVQRWWIGARP